MHRIIRYCWPLLLLPTLFAQPAERPFFTDPSISPNRAEIAFVSGGDIWVAPLAGGEAHLLVSHPASESRPIYSPDGTRLAFISTRTGNGDIYVLTLATGAIKRITFDDVADALDAWSRDGKWLYFSSSAQDIGGMQDIYRVSAEGGVPMPVTNDRYVTEFHAAPSPDGNSLAFTARGNTFGQWWRHGHSHIDESEIWLTSLNGDPKYQRIAGGDFKCLWPMWSADGSRVYYMSDQGGAENLWEKPVRNGAPKQVTQFHDGRLLWPSISYDGKTIVFERDFTVWKLDLASGKAAPIPITRRGAPGTPEAAHLSLNNQFRDLTLAPDGRKVAFTAHGDVFAAGAREGGSSLRVSRTTANESQIAWSPDSRRTVYVSDRDGAYHLYTFDFSSAAEARVTNDAGDETGAPTANSSPSFAMPNNSASTTPPRSRCVLCPPGDFRARPSAPIASMRGLPIANGLPTLMSARAASAMYTWCPPREASRSRSAFSPIPTAARSCGRPTARTSCSIPTNAPKTTTLRASIWR
jgi:Tol biopolymer transport system component